MSEKNLVPGASQVLDGRAPLSGSPHSGGHGLGWKAWQVAKVVQARLRFAAILAAVGAALVYWDTLNAYYEKWTRPLLGAETAVSPDTEYRCPMHPTVVRDHPDKCPICNMPLSKRKKGAKEEDEALPPGVVSRVQLIDGITRTLTCPVVHL